MHSRCERCGPRRVSMHADRVGFERHARTVDGENGSGQGGFNDPSDNLIGSHDDRARFGPRHERPIGTVGAIGERLARAAETSGSSGGDELRSR